MEALPESLAALAGMSMEQLIMLWLIGMSIAMSKTLRRLLALCGNKIFGKGTFNTNGNHAEAIDKEARENADAVRAELRRHDDGCRESYKQVSRNFEKVFGILREHGKSIARIEGYLKGREEKAA